MKLQITTIVLIVFFTLIFSVSCKDKSEFVVDYPILKASLEENEVSIYDIFEKAVIIPLETTEESSFRYPEKVVINRDTVCVFDSSLNSLYFFSFDGRYLSKIHKVGHGPEEYILVCDFLINHDENTIELLNPMGSVHKYRNDGTFVGKYDLPKPPLNYKNFMLLDKSHYITWSCVHDDNGVNILTSNDYQISNCYFPNSILWSAFIRNVFYKYQDCAYYYESMTNKVYHITPTDSKIAYEWDLGVEIINPKRLVSPLERMNETLIKMGEDFKEGEIPFCFDNQYQTDSYYYATLRFGLSFASRKSLFYKKETNESILFNKTTEGIKFDPVLMNDEYAVGVLQYEYKEALHSIVSKEDGILLNEMKEDDIWLVKFFFK